MSFRKFLKLLSWVIGCFILLAGVIYIIAWKSPAYYIVSKPYNLADSIIPFSRYNEIINHPPPLHYHIRHSGIHYLIPDEV